ncbi:MAG: NAD(P)/FAD-dependent oxidoreductase [Chloroflexi bacterium]|nr:NAD(P)/FAD-dependent oxidoreductase [Chloroflexota bacterium]
MKLLIVGNGVAGTTAARLAAERDPSAEIHLYGDEPHLYYPRPRLINYLVGELSPETLPQYPQKWYDKRNIHTHIGQALSSINPNEHQVELTDGSLVDYDKLILANGACSFIPPITGSQLEGVVSLRTWQDADKIRALARPGAHAVVLGGGLLGLDLAAALCALQTHVTVVEMMPRLLPRQLDEQGALVLTEMLTKRCMHIIVGDQCQEVCGQERVERVKLKSGMVLPVDLVAISAGIRPNIALAQTAGITCNRGVVVDDLMQTSAKDVYAIGDVAEHGQLVLGIIPVALAQAKIAVGAVFGDSTIYIPIVPSTTLKVTGIDLVSMGDIHAASDDIREVRVTDSAAGIYKKLVIRNGVVIGAILLGDLRQARTAAALIEKKLDVSGVEERLLDKGFDPAGLEPRKGD